MAEPPSEHHIKRFKFIWRVLMISNLALGVPYGVSMIVGLDFIDWKDQGFHRLTRPLAGYMFIGAKKRDIGIVSKKKAKEISIKKHRAVVEEVPSSPPVPPPAPPPTTTTNSETWDL